MSVALDSDAAVRDYLRFVEDPNQLIDDTRIAELERAVAEAADPLDRLRAVAELERCRRPDESAYRDAFIRHAKLWAEQNNVPASAFTVLGVDDAALEDAGLLPAARSRQHRPRLVRIGDIRAAVTTWTERFTYADVERKVGGSPMTIRKAINQLVDDGTVVRLGPDPDWHGKGQSPHLFQLRQ